MVAGLILASVTAKAMRNNGQQIVHVCIVYCTQYALYATESLINFISYFAMLLVKGNIFHGTHPATHVQYAETTAPDFLSAFTQAV